MMSDQLVTLHATFENQRKAPVPPATNPAGGSGGRGIAGMETSSTSPIA